MLPLASRRLRHRLKRSLEGAPAKSKVCELYPLLRPEAALVGELLWRIIVHHASSLKSPYTKALGVAVAASAIKAIRVCQAVSRCWLAGPFLPFPRRRSRVFQFSVARIPHSARCYGENILRARQRFQGNRNRCLAWSRCRWAARR